MSVETRTISAEEPISLISCDVLPPVKELPEDFGPAEGQQDPGVYTVPTAPEGPHG